MKKNYTELNKTNSKKIIVLIISLITFLIPQKNYGQAWQWALSNSGSNSDYGGSTCVDPLGNVILTGNFSSSPFQIGSVILNNAGLSGSDGYVAKVDPAGNVLWAQRIGGTSNEYINGVCTDATGNVYVVGQYNSNSLSIPPYTVGNYTNNATYDIFVACYNSAGSIQWLKSFGNLKDDQARSCVYSNSLSALYVAGTYYSATLTMGTNTLTNTNSTGANTDIFLARLTSTGNVTWAKTTGSINSSDYVGGLVIDSNSDPYFCGSFTSSTNTTVIGVTTLTTIGGTDMLIAKYNSSGTGQWAKNFGTSFNGSGDFIGDIGMDASNNIYVTGTYLGGSLIAGTVTLTNSGGYDAFVAKANSSGVFQWGQKIAGTLDEYGNSLTVDGNNNIYITGAITGTNVVVGTVTLTNSNPGNTNEVYVLKYNATGSVQWGVTAKGADNETGNSISADVVGNVYVSGNFYTAPTAFGTTTLSNTGTTDAFLAKIGCLTTSITGFSTVCNGSSVTLTGNGATSYTWNTTATTTSISVSPTATTVYTVSGSTGSCVGTSSSFTVNWLPASLNPGSNLNLQCNQKQVMAATCTPSNPTSVSWSPSTGLSSTSVLNPTVTANGPGTVYTVSVNLNNGCSLSKTVSVTPDVPTPDICMVTVDSAGVNNEIYWDKTNYPMLDSMIISRETSTNIYKRIGAVSRTALSMFVDTVRSVGPANGDPKISTYRYKIHMRDTCGNYSQKSLWHNTVYFTNNNGTFLWTNNYQVEGTPIPTNPVVNYSLIVFPNPTVTPVTFSVVGITAGNQNSLADPNYSVYANTAEWRVEANLGYQCQPTFKPVNGASPVLLKATKSRSNIQNNKTSGIKEYISSSLIKIYPNPTKDVLNIRLDSSNEKEITINIENVLGQTIEQLQLNGKTTTLNISDLSNGVYFVRFIKNNKAIVVKKIVVDK